MIFDLQQSLFGKVGLLLMIALLLQTLLHELDLFFELLVMVIALR